MLGTPGDRKDGYSDKTAKTEVPCFNRRGTINIPLCSKAVGAKNMSRRRVTSGYVSEIFSSRTLNNKNDALWSTCVCASKFIQRWGWVVHGLHV